MKIELKNVKFAEHMSEETNAFTADIIINGINAGYAKNDGRGGPTDCRPHFEHRELFKQAEAFCLTLPPIDYGTFKHKMDMEAMVDQLFEDWLKEKEQKKLETKMQRCILVKRLSGDINMFSYPKTKLSELPLIKLQSMYDTIKKQLKPGEKFLNTNLEKLGVKL